jgi:hypothetical protein
MVLCDQVLKKLKDPVFTGSIKFITGIIIIPIYYLLFASIIYVLWGVAAAMTAITLSVLSLMARKWSLTY